MTSSIGLSRRRSAKYLSSAEGSSGTSVGGGGGTVVLVDDEDRELEGVVDAGALKAVEDGKPELVVWLVRELSNFFARSRP